MEPQVHTEHIDVYRNIEIHLIQEFDWLLDTIEWRWQKEFKNKKSKKPYVPSLEQGNSSYKQIVTHFNLNEDHRLIFLLTLAPFFIPEALTKTVTGSKDYSPITYGARKILHNDQFFPTGTTALFLLGGNKFNKRLEAYNSLVYHPLLQLERNLINIGMVETQEPITNGILSVDHEVINYLAGNGQLETLTKTISENE